MSISTPRLDSLTAGGTSEVFDGIRLADGHVFTLKVGPGAEAAEVFLFPGLTAPGTEAWEHEDQWEVWLTGGVGDGSLYLDVPVEAVRDLIVQHGGEHENQAAPWQSPGKTDEAEKAEAIAISALAEWGITAHQDEESMIGGDRNTWLVVGYDQTRKGFPRMLAEPYVVLYLYSDTDEEEITVDRAPASGDEWTVLVGDSTGAEYELITRPADRFAECVEAIADWVTNPLPTAGSVLLAALAKYGVIAHTDVGLSYAIPLDPTTPASEAYSRAHLSVADRSPSIEHDPAAAHTGWTVFLHDANGEPVGDPLYITGDGEPVDCTADSAAAAELIADWLTAHRN
ncbi:hypothetical protein [Streptomyces sp. NPDC058475]|uniref:hypothetical protein n=1 Tax=unclassified Streptomyces TaxID=2593676 RepID=UPI003664F944